jgi:hypothetical protein
MSRKDPDAKPRKDPMGSQEGEQTKSEKQKKTPMRKHLLFKK